MRPQYHIHIIDKLIGRQTKNAFKLPRFSVPILESIKRGDFRSRRCYALGVLQFFITVQDPTQMVRVPPANLRTWVIALPWPPISVLLSIGVFVEQVEMVADGFAFTEGTQWIDDVEVSGGSKCPPSMFFSIRCFTLSYETRSTRVDVSFVLEGASTIHRIDAFLHSLGTEKTF